MKQVQNQQLLQLGQFFRLFRVGRGLTLKQAAGELSVATLSRFERGELDLSSDKALVLMRRLGVEPFDFFQYYQSDLANYPLGVTPLAQVHDVSAIKAWKVSYFEAQSKTHAMTNLAKQLFEVAVRWPDPQFQLAASAEQQIVDGLVDLKSGDLFQVEWIKMLIAPASHELLDILYHRAVSVGQSSKAVQSRWLLLIWLGALMNHDLNLAGQIKSALASVWIEDEHPLLALNDESDWLFGQALSAYVQAPTPAHATPIKQLVSDLDEMGMSQVARWYHGMYLHAQTSSVHHNLKLIDHRRAPKPVTSLGALIQHRRSTLGMRRVDLDSYSSVSALWRFENDQTQLSFTTLSQVMGQLALLPSQALAMIDQNNTPSNQRAFGLAAAFWQISRDPANAVQIIAQFEQDHADQPPIIASEQLFVLRMKAKLPASGDKTLAQQILARLLRTNTWYTLEMYLVEALVEWLPAPKLATLFQHGHRLFSQSSLINGGDHYFEGLNQALAKVTAQEPPDVVASWLSQFSWLLTVNSDSSAQWLAIGSWYTAHYLLETTPKAQAALQSYLDRSKRVGYASVPRRLAKTWQGQVEATLFSR
jgi:transcriptional regulator with XRE-family HTH domain